MTYADYLKHHGIKGQKWGVQHGPPYPLGSKTAEKVRKKYYDENGSLNKRGVGRLKRETKKLHKLQDRANVELQRERAENYGKKAKSAAQVARTAAISALALKKGGGIASDLVKNQISKRLKADLDRSKEIADKAADVWWEKYQSIERNYGDTSDSKQWTKLKNDAKRYNDEAHSKETKRSIVLEDRAYSDWSDRIKALDKVNTARNAAVIGITAGSVIASGVYSYNKIQKHMADKRVSEVGHAKAEARVQEQMDKMFNMFGDMKYEDFVNSKDKKSK